MKEKNQKAQIYHKTTLSLSTSLLLTVPVSHDGIWYIVFSLQSYLFNWFNWFSLDRRCTWRFSLHGQYLLSLCLTAAWFWEHLNIFISLHSNDAIISTTNLVCIFFWKWWAAFCLLYATCFSLKSLPGFFCVRILSWICSCIICSKSKRDIKETRTLTLIRQSMLSSL